jgi:hypothetical protein
VVLAVTIEQDNEITLHESACSSANYHTTYKQIVLTILSLGIVSEEIGLSQLFPETIRVELRFMVRTHIQNHDIEKQGHYSTTLGTKHDLLAHKLCIDRTRCRIKHYEAL